MKAIVALMDLHAFQVRVVQNKEPEHFLRMFRGRFIILEVRFYDHNHHPFSDKFFCPTPRAPEFPLPLLTRATQSKDRFPLSRYFYVLLRVKFECVNKIEEMHKRSRFKSWARFNFTFTSDLYISAISFTHVNYAHTYVKTTRRWESP